MNSSDPEGRVRALIAQVFTTEEAVNDWMNTSARGLGDQTPLEMLLIDPDRAENYARQVVWGVP